MGPLSLIFWGTKVRRQSHGMRAELCPGCLCVTKQHVTAIEKSFHVYNIPWGYREVGRYSECPLCGSAVGISPDVPVLKIEGVDDKTIEEIIALTNPSLSAEHVRALEFRLGLSTRFQREAYVFRTFCRNQLAEFDAAAENLSGWAPLIVIVVLILTGYAISYAGILPGIAAGATLLSVCLTLRRRMIDAAVSRKIVPRLQLFLRAMNRDIEWLDQFLDRQIDQQLRQLRRHLLSSHYNRIRMLAAGVGREPVGAANEYLVLREDSTGEG